jgi:hypothetical protein
LLKDESKVKVRSSREMKDESENREVHVEDKRSRGGLACGFNSKLYRLILLSEFFEMT